MFVSFICGFQMWEDFFIIIIRMKPEGAVKVENGGETVLKSELGIRHNGRTGSEIENYG